MKLEFTNPGHAQHFKGWLERVSRTTASAARLDGKTLTVPDTEYVRSNRGAIYQTLRSYNVTVGR